MLDEIAVLQMTNTVCSCTETNMDDNQQLALFICSDVFAVRAKRKKRLGQLGPVQITFIVTLVLVILVTSALVLAVEFIKSTYSILQFLLCFT